MYCISHDVVTVVQTLTFSILVLPIPHCFSITQLNFYSSFAKGTPSRVSHSITLVGNINWSCGKGFKEKKSTNLGRGKTN